MADTYLDCPVCGEPCRELPANAPTPQYPYGYWEDGDSVTCHCGAELEVCADGESAWLEDASECDECHGAGFYLINGERQPCICSESQADEAPARALCRCGHTDAEHYSDAEARGRPCRECGCLGMERDDLAASEGKVSHG